MTKIVTVQCTENDIADIPFLRLDPIHASKPVSFVKIDAEKEFRHSPH